MTTPEKAPYSPFNKPKFAALERIVCSYLIESLTANPIESVLFICKAGLLLPDKEVEKLDVDIDRVMSIFTVAERFSATSKLGGDLDFKPISFTDLDFDEEVGPWVSQVTFSYHPGRREPHELAEMDDKRRFLILSQLLSASGFKNIKSAFLKYAVPYTQKLGGTLTSLISPETYSTMLKVYKGVKNVS